ncbi:MAG: DNA gyrase subunit A [Mariprofundaceae bacterium]|nr:DNA gyrase subunit A [Mariprofundaceae bacterium]
MDQQSSVLPVLIEDKMRHSYLDYAMSVIVGRALPDARDGLKPVHRRILFAMHELGCASDKPYKKSARVVGDVIGKYHPHGDTAVYDALVRMAQPWSMRHLLIDGQGNFGSIDGDSPAAMRYTEVRMSKLSSEMLADIDKDTIDFTPTYDDSMKEPSVLPTRYPNLLVNGSTGIAVGMATNIPPHNLGESIRATIALIQDKFISDDELMLMMPAPDFPTGGFIYGQEGARQAFLNGRGTITMRARTAIEISKNERAAVIVTELPYQVNKATLIENIAHLVRDKKLEGISDLRDESDREGMRIVIELKRDEMPEIVLNNLFKQTQLQCNFSANMLALIDNKPRLCGVRELLLHFIDHRRQVVTRRTLFDLDKAKSRAHILEGLMIALNNIDSVIKVIRACKNAQLAKDALIENYHLSLLQTQAILEMRLQRLTGLEYDKISAENSEVTSTITRLELILADDNILMKVITDELQAITEQYSTPRMSEIIDATGELSLEDLIVREDMVVTISHQGYIKRNPASTYQVQHRGGKGKTAMKTKNEDFVSRLIVASTHDYLMFFSNRGRVFKKKVYEIPSASRTARGKAMVNVLPLEKDEQISATLAISSFDDEGYILMATRLGLIKKTKLTAYKNVRSNGIIAVKLNEKDDLISVSLSLDGQGVLMAASNGKSIRFSVDDIRSSGRDTKGVTGIRMNPAEKLVGMSLLDADTTILSVSENGFGKRTHVDEFRVQNRGGKGVYSLKTDKRNGSMVAALQVHEDDHLMLITDTGRLTRIPASGISIISRHTLGVKLMGCNPKEKVIGVVCIADNHHDDNGEHDDNIENAAENDGEDHLVEDNA